MESAALVTAFAICQEVLEFYLFFQTSLLDSPQTLTEQYLRKLIDSHGVISI